MKGCIVVIPTLFARFMSHQPYTSLPVYISELTEENSLVQQVRTYYGLAAAATICLYLSADESGFDHEI